MMDFSEVLINVLSSLQRVIPSKRHESDTWSFRVINCSICSIWSCGEAAVSRPGISMVDGSGFGCHLGGFGGTGFRLSGIMVANKEVETRRVSAPEILFRSQGCAKQLSRFAILTHRLVLLTYAHFMCHLSP